MHLSASAIGKFSCPYAYWLWYDQKIRPSVEDESKTVGTAYHKCLEMEAEALTEDDREAIRSWLCEEFQQSHPLVYSKVLAGFDARCAVGADTPFTNMTDEVLTEHRWELDYNGHTVVGVFDHVLVSDNIVTITDYKSTSSKFGDDLFWKRARRSRQISLYYWAARQLWPDKTIEIFFDVWHKINYRPSALTIKETELLLTPNGTDPQYCGVDIEILSEDQLQWKNDKKKQLIETPAMLYARMYQHYITEPSFDRRFIPRLGSDTGRVEANLDKIIRVMEYMNDNDAWFQNEDMCSNYGGCEYAPLCDNCLDPTVDELPDTLMRKEVE
jgi:hypothetical protein